MPYYIAIIDHDGEVFGAHFPDAPGCTAMGATEDELIANAIDALAEWVSGEISDGRKAPEPRTYLQLLREGTHNLGQGGMIARIPLMRETGKVTRANISIDAGLLASMDEEAGRLGITRSAYVAAAVRDRMKQIAGA